MEGSKDIPACALLCSSCAHACRQPAFDVVVVCPRYEASEEWLRGHQKGQGHRDTDGTRVAEG